MLNLNDYKDNIFFEFNFCNVNIINRFELLVEDCFANHEKTFRDRGSGFVLV